VASEEVVTSSSTEKGGTILVFHLQYLVRLTIAEAEGVLVPELGTPEGPLVGIDSVIRAAADQSVGGYVLVGIELMCNGLVELSTKALVYMEYSHPCNTPLWEGS
jgi:hypothetical protein